MCAYKCKDAILLPELSRSQLVLAEVLYSVRSLPRRNYSARVCVCVCMRATILSTAAELIIRSIVNSTVESSQSVA